MNDVIYSPIDLPEDTGFYWAWMARYNAFCLMSVERRGEDLVAAAWAAGFGPMQFGTVLHLKLFEDVTWYGPNVPIPEAVHLTGSKR